MSNDEILNYVQFIECITKLIFGILETWKCDLFSFFNGPY